MSNSAGPQREPYGPGVFLIRLPRSGSFPRRRPGLPGSWRTPMRTCPALRPRWDRPRQADYSVADAALRSDDGVGSHNVKLFRGSITRPAHSLSTPRSAGYPATTQDSLPAAGHLCRAGLTARRVPTKGFSFYIASPFPRLRLAHHPAFPGSERPACGWQTKVPDGHLSSPNGGRAVDSTFRLKIAAFSGAPWLHAPLARTPASA